jgi:hypothetical protein
MVEENIMQLSVMSIRALSIPALQTELLSNEYSEITRRTLTSQLTQIHGDCQPQTHHVHDMNTVNENSKYKLGPPN